VPSAIACILFSVAYGKDAVMWSHGKPMVLTSCDQQHLLLLLQWILSVLSYVWILSEELIDSSYDCSIKRLFIILVGFIQ